MTASLLHCLQCCVSSTPSNKDCSLTQSIAFAMLFSNESWLHYGVSGTWVVFLALVVVDCMHCSPNSKRMFVLWPIPKKLFPIALTSFFCVCKANILPYMPALFVGYVIHVIGQCLSLANVSYQQCYSNLIKAS